MTALPQSLCTEGNEDDRRTKLVLMEERAQAWQHHFASSQKQLFHYLIHCP